MFRHNFIIIMSTIVEVSTPQNNSIYNLEESQHVNMQAVVARPIGKDVLLEFLGTFTFVYISLAGVNQAVLTDGSQLQVAICFTIGLAAGVVVAGRSGAHLNPAVSFTVLMVDNDFTVRRFVYYVVAQFLGGVLAGLIILSVYSEWINSLPESNVLIGSFGTLRNPNMSLGRAILDQFIGSALLMFGIRLSVDSHVRPITIGLVLGSLGLFQGTNGFAFNLARDLGPRVASAIIFGSDAFSAMDYWFWVPMVIPFVGVPFGWVMAYLLEEYLS